jgi:dTDP-4-amino-4,6-dideoxygalactose transaminase
LTTLFSGTGIRPAAHGGRPAFPEGLPLARPRVPDPERVATDIAGILASGALTNGRYVRELEQRAATYLGVPHCVAVSSCTAGLMLVLKSAGLSGEVVVPSFTFAATAHAVAWNGLRVSFADVDPDTLTLAPEDAARSIGLRTSALLATHTFGTPCDVDRLADLAEQNGIALFFDAAHAFGSTHHGVRVGNFGRAEVFSLSPTKLLVACEGGLIATSDPELADRCRIGRDYGNPGDYDCRFVGLNARMSEVHAAVALASLDGIEERVGRRNALAATYRKLLDGIEGVTLPSVPDGDRSTYKDFTILVDPDRFGTDAAGLATALRAEGIETRRYYAPAVHEMKAYRAAWTQTRDLPVTETITARVLTLPLWPELTDGQLDRVVEAIARIGAFLGNGHRSPTPI